MLCFGASAFVTAFQDLGQEQTVSTRDFYDKRWGHWVEHLEIVYDGLKKAGCTNFVWLAGDSTVDNKPFREDWKEESWKTAVRGYEDVLSPPQMLPDVNYLLNEQFQESPFMAGETFCAINTARAGSQLQSRIGGRALNPQDQLLQSHASEGDVLILSVGGNDLLAGWKMS